METGGGVWHKKIESKVFSLIARLIRKRAGASRGGTGGCELVATRRGPYPRSDGGVEVRKVFHKLRSQASEPFNGLYKNVFEWRVQMPVKGLRRSQLLALGAVVLYQLVLLYQHEHSLPLGRVLSRC